MLLFGFTIFLYLSISGTHNNNNNKKTTRTMYTCLVNSKEIEKKTTTSVFYKQKNFHIKYDTQT